MSRPSPFRYFKTSPEIIRLAVMMYVRFPLSLRNVEDLLHERGIEISHETVRFWWNRFGPMFAAEIRRKRVEKMRAFSNWRWHVDEVFVKINGERHYLWRAVDHEGEVLEVFVSKRRDRRAALKFLKKSMRRYGRESTFRPARLATEQAAIARMCQHDDRRIKARETAMLTGASRALHDEAAFMGNAAGAANTAMTMALLPAYHGFRICQQGCLGFWQLSGEFAQSGQYAVVSQARLNVCLDADGEQIVPLKLAEEDRMMEILDMLPNIIDR